MISQFLAQRSNLFGCHWAGIVPPLATFVCENVRNLLVGQCLVPRLHYRGTEFLAFHGDWSLQTLHDNHGRPARAAGCKLLTGQRRILPCHSETVRLVTCLAIRGKNLLSAIMRRKFGCLLGALRSGNLFHCGHFTAVWIERFTAKISRVTAEISAAKKYCQSVHCDQPDGKRFATHTRLTFFPLHRGMDILDVSDFAVIHTLAGMRLRWWSAFVHLGGGCPPGAAEGEAAGDAAGAAPADLTSFNGCD